MKASIIFTAVAALIVCVLYLADEPSSAPAQFVPNPSTPLPTFKVQ
jgi:hypothetical protein